MAAKLFSLFGIRVVDLCLGVRYSVHAALVAMSYCKSRWHVPGIAGCVSRPIVSGAIGSISLCTVIGVESVPFFSLDCLPCLFTAVRIMFVSAFSFSTMVLKSRLIQIRRIPPGKSPYMSIKASSVQSFSGISMINTVVLEAFSR